MATLPNLTPDSTGTVSGVSDQAGGTTNLHTVVSDASDATYLTAGVDLPGTVLLGLSNVPGDFASMDTLGYEIRLRLNGTVADDSMTFSATVYDGNATTTPLTNTVQVATQANAGGAFNLKTGAFTIQGTPTTTQWNNAFLHLEWTYTKSMASDGISIRVSEAAITGTYTQSNLPPNEPVIASPLADGLVGGASVSLEATISDPDGDNVRAAWELWTNSKTPAGTISGSIATTGVDGLAWDGANIWALESAVSDNIYKLASDGTVLATLPVPGSSPSGLTWDGSSLWVIDQSTSPHSVAKIDPADGTVLDSFATQDTSTKRGLAWDGTHLWVSQDSLVERYSTAGAFDRSITPPTSGLRDITWKDGSLWAANVSTNIFYEMDPSDGSIIGSTYTTPGSSGGTYGMTWDGNSLRIGNVLDDVIYAVSLGDVLVEDITDNLTTVISGSTHTTTWDASTVTAGYYDLRAWGVDSLGSQSTTYDAVSVSVGLPSTPVITAPTGGATVAGTTSLEATVSDPDGDAVYARWEVGTLGGTQLDQFASTGTNPTGLAWNGTEFFQASAPNDQIYRISATGTLLNTYASPGTFPQDIALNSDYSRMWNLDDGDELIYELNPASPGSAPLNSFAVPDPGIVRGLTHDGVALWTCDNSGAVIFRVNEDNGTVLNSFNAPGSNPVGLAWDGANLWCLDGTDNIIYRLDTSDGTVLETFTPPSPTGPSAMEHNGTDFYVGVTSDTITRFTSPDFQAITANTTTVASGGTHTTSWDAAALSGGDYFLRAWAVDAGGAQSASYDQISITISSALPVGDSLHGHVSDDVTLTAIIDPDAFHAHLSETVEMLGATVSGPSTASPSSDLELTLHHSGYFGPGDDIDGWTLQRDSGEYWDHAAQQWVT